MGKNLTLPKVFKTVALIFVGLIALQIIFVTMAYFFLKEQVTDICYYYKNEHSYFTSLLLDQ